MTDGPSHPLPDLSGWRCLVTGGSRTLGAAIVRQLAAQGAQLVVNYHRSEEAAHSLCHELQAGGAVAHAVQADVSQEDQAQRLVAHAEARIGPLDLLVNNVGPYVDTPFLQMPVDDFDRILAGNVRATFLLSQLVGTAMKARGHGQIINIAATDVYHRSHSIYGLAKQGVIHLTQAMALELAPQVRIHALAPDLIADNEDMTPDFVASAVDATPMARLVTRSEIAQMVCLLTSPVFAMTTGHTVIMDGGRSIPRMAGG